jgi:membrane fusion protein, multidrug efflux system
MEKSANNKWKIYFPVGLVLIAVLTGAIIWYHDYTHYITTEDAKVDADNITVSSKILGRIFNVYANEGDAVQKGQLLAELDSTDMLAQKKQAVAVRDQALSGLKLAGLKYSSDIQALKVVEINLERAKDDFERAKKQSDGGVISEEQFSHMKKAYEAAAAQEEASKALLSVSKTQVENAAAAVETSNAQVKVLETQLKNTKLSSPATGVVARRWLMPGDVIQPGQSVFTVTDGKMKWITAYLEETKISQIKDGQAVQFTLDAFAHVKFHGKVFLTGTSTASVFSLIPANNASGNFTKVTQRIPVRISIDSASDGKNVSDYCIVPGMSAIVKITKTL